ncbi:MAG: TonB-dependent receptor [Gammaproteobacteria bacterium]|nr:TonB-dependent receptor [Gammaproteobacteria bacterium]
MRKSGLTAGTPPLLLVLVFANTGLPVHAQEPQDITELDEIVVQETEEPVTSQPLGTAIRGETLSTLPGSAGDPLRALQSLPGLVYTDDENALPAVRGSRPDDNYFQTDFVPATYLFHAGGTISVYNTDLVESFSIYPSAYSAEFSGVTGGVFDVTLRDPQTDRLQGTIDLSFLHFGALIEGPIARDQSFYLAGRASVLDVFVEDQLEEEDGITIEQFPKYTDYQGKYVWAPSDESKLTFQINGATDEFDATVREDSEEIATDPIFAGRNYEETSFNEQALVWEGQLDDNLGLKTALAHSASQSVGQAGGAGDIDIKTDDLLLKSRAIWELSEQHELSLGAQVLQTEADLDIAFSLPPCSEFDPDCQITGSPRLETAEVVEAVATQFYVQDSWSLTDRLTLFPGVAFQSENYLDKSFVEPRLAAEFSVSDSLVLNAGTGLYHQFPGFIEVNEVFGNPELDYIKSVHGVVGLEKTFNDGWHLKADAHYKLLDDLVTTDDDLRFTNEGEGSAYGLDLLLRKRLTDRLSGWLSVGWSEARRKDKRTGQSFVFEYDQPYNVTLVGSYKLSDRWSIGAKLWAHSGAPYTPVVGATADDEVEGLYNPEYGTLNSARFDDYQRLDIRVDRTFKRRKGKNMSAYLEVLNALGRKNVSGLDYSADYSEATEVEQLPTILALGFKASF